LRVRSPHSAGPGAMSMKTFEIFAHNVHFGEFFAFLASFLWGGRKYSPQYVLLVRDRRLCPLYFLGSNSILRNSLRSFLLQFGW